MPLARTDYYVAGATWGDDDVIVFGGTHGLKRMPAGGGEASVLTTPTARAGESGHFHPHALPDGRGWLYTVAHGPFFADLSVWVHSAGGESRRLLDDAADARYVKTGHIVFAQRGKLMAAPFDLGDLRLTGNIVGIFDSVLQALNGGLNANRTGTAQYAFSETGNLAYVTGGINRDRTNSLVWIDLATGVSEPLALPKMPYVAPRLSPNQQHIAVTARGSNGTAVWVYDLKRNGPTKLPFEGHANFALWTPDGKRVVFTGHGKNVPFELYSVPADGSTPATALTNGEGGVAATWDADGNLIFVKPSTTVLWDDRDIMLLSMKDNNVRPLLAQPGVNEFDPTLSPDGKWLAYTSNESGREQVSIQPYPALDKKIPVSTRPGGAPRWVRDGKGLGLLFRELGEGTVRVMRVEIDIRARDIVVSTPREVWRGPNSALSDAFPVPGFEVTPDGRRLLGVELEDPTPPAPTLINLVQDWFEELRAKVRPGR